MCRFVPNGTFLPSSLSPVFPHPSGSLLCGPPLINFGTFSAPAPSMAPQGLSDSDQEFSPVFRASCVQAPSQVQFPFSPSPHSPAVTKPKYTLFLEHPAAILPPLIAQAVPTAQNTLASFSLPSRFILKSHLTLKTQRCSSFPPHFLPSHIHPIFLIRQQTVPEPPLCVRPHVGFAGDTTVTKALPS